jgi:HEAT repeat protein
MQQNHSSPPALTAIPLLPDHVSKSQRDFQTAHRAKESWENADYSACLHLLRSLDTVENREALTNIYAILLSASEGRSFALHRRSIRRAISEQAVQCLCASPSENAYPLLTKMLFLKEPLYANRAEEALARHGSAMLFALCKELGRVNAPPYWHLGGELRVLNLLTRFGDKRVCDILIAAAQKRMPYAVIFDSKYEYRMALWGLAILFFRLWWPSVWNMGVLSTGSMLALTSSLSFRFLRKKYQLNQGARLALQGLQVIHDKRVAPPLVSLTWSLYGETDEEALKALRPLLPLITTEDEGIFSLNEEHLLVKALERHDEELTLSILHTLECVGTEGSLPRIKWLAKQHSDSRIRDSAIRAYNAIEERANRKEERKNLLRASETPEHTQELLRPAQDDSEHEVQKRELLRPTEEEL